jgi:hypothetical protein
LRDLPVDITFLQRPRQFLPGEQENLHALGDVFQECIERRGGICRACYLLALVDHQEAVLAACRICQDRGGFLH